MVPSEIVSGEMPGKIFTVTLRAAEAAEVYFTVGAPADNYFVQISNYFLQIKIAQLWTRSY